MAELVGEGTPAYLLTVSHFLGLREHNVLPPYPAFVDFHKLRGTAVVVVVHRPTAVIEEIVVFRGQLQNLMVTPRDIDAQVRDLAKVVGYGINWALQDLEIEEINALLS